MHSYDSLFPLANSWALIVCLLIAFFSIVLFMSGQFSLAVGCLFISGLFLRVFIAHLDPFLHEWDERFHALVARNMMHDPFRPMLRVNELVPMGYKDWAYSHLWLHKQPLFMWQMALSMKIFGVSEFAIRYPGALMGSISILMIYRIALLMTSNKSIAFIAAVLTCFSNYPLELLSGIRGMDQNDTAFSFYVIASLWAYAEYRVKKQWKWAILAGLLSGGAILIKWLTGLLVFSAWGLITLSSVKSRDFKSQVLHFALALTTAVMVFLPWQLYIFHAFPAEANFEYNYNMRHLQEVVEGHGGDWLYYVRNFSLYYGDALCWLLPIGLFVMLFLKRYYSQLSLAFVIYFGIALTFFSLVSPTKLDGYFMLVLPVGNIFIAVTVFHIINFKHIYKFAFFPAVVLSAFLIFNLGDITNKHNPKNTEIDWATRAYNTSIYRNFKNQAPASVLYAMNVKEPLDFMFYNNRVDAYHYVLGPAELEKIKQQHASIAVYHDSGKNDIPAYLAGYDSVYIIPVKFKQ